MDPNTFTNLVITLMVIIIVVSAIKTVILHFILDSIDEICCKPRRSDRK